MKNRSFKQNSLCIAIKRSLLVITVLGIHINSVPVFANTPITQNVKISSGSLAKVVNEFSEQLGILLTYDAKLLEGKKSVGLSGSYNLNNGFYNILSQHNLQIQETSVGYTIVVTPKTQQQTDYAEEQSHTDSIIKNANDNFPIRLPVITLHAESNVTEGTKSYTAGKMRTATKLDLSIRETPQTVTVVTHQKIEDKSHSTLDQVIADTPGLIANQNFGDARYQYWSRGLIIDNMQYDGVSSPVQYYARDSDGADDMDMYDRVEVLRGASGLTTGAGNPSGAINLIRKKPFYKQETTITTRASSWGNGKAVLDHSAPLNAEKTVRGRFVTSYGFGQTYKDDSFNKEGLFYGTIEADLNNDTTINMGYSYQKQKTDGYDWGGLPVQTDGSFYNFSPSSFIGNDWQYLDREQHTAFLELEHRFENDWKLNIASRASWSNSEMGTSFSSYSGSDLYLYDRLFNYDNDVYSLDANFNGSIEAFGRDHNLLFGVNANHTNLKILNSLGSTTLIRDPINPNLSSSFDYSSFTPFSQLSYQTEQIGAYAAGRFSITDSLKFITGARLSWYDYDSTTTILSTKKVTENQIKENSIFTPYLGLVYDLNDAFSFYASYTSIFQPQYNFGRDGSLLDPITGTNIEAGLKAELFDKNLNGAFSVFQVMRDNVASQLPDITFCNPTVKACYEGVDGVRTRGAEFELSGSITDSWRMAGGYTYAVSKHTEGALSGEKFATHQYPEHVFKLFTTYSFPEEKFSIGGGMRAQSKLYYKTPSLDIEQPAYTIFDMMGKYDFNQQTSIQLNIDNVFDKGYYSALNTNAGYGFFMGAPRNFKLTLKHSF